MSLFLPGLLAFLALPIIIALHLIRRRRKQQRLPSLRLWNELAAPMETRVRWLPITWLLLLHLLVGLCLAFALLRPETPTFGSSVPQHTTLIIDITSSMGANDVRPSRFVQAQAAAFDHIDELQPSDSLAILTLEATPRLLATGTAADAARLRSEIQALAPAGSGGDLQRTLELANSTLEQNKHNTIVILTDQALPTVDGTIEAQAPVEWRTWGEVAPNVAITTLAARRIPSGEVSVYARIMNADAPSRSQEVSLLVDDEVFAQETVSIPENGIQELVWQIPADSERIEAVIESDDALPVDDRARLPLQAVQNTRVRIVSPLGRDTSALERVFSALPGLQVTVAEQDDPQNPVDVSILNGILPQPLPTGALLIIDPPAGDERLPVINTLISDRAANASLDEAFAQVDLSSVQWNGRRPLDELDPSLRPVIRDVNGVPLVVRGTLEGQPTVIWAFDVQSSNLPARLAFPLLSAASIQVLTGGSLPPTLPPGTRATAFDLVDPDGELVTGRINQAGWYTVQDQPGQVAVNFGDAQEFRLAPQTQPTINIVPIDQSIQPQRPPREALWAIFVVAALLTLLLEWWYIFRK